MIGIMSLDPCIYNYGGFLQELALQDILKGLGYECEIINYPVRNELNTFSMKRGLRYFSWEKIANKISNLKKKNWDAEASEAVRIRESAFDLYRQKVLSISDDINYTALHSGTLKYDSYICGSDQIWNPDYNIPAFFLNFVGTDKRTIAYGASIGKAHLTSLQMAKYKELLKNLNYVSVREYSAKDLLQPICEKRIEVVLDPTLLHDKHYWEQRANESVKTYTDYIFCYFLEPNADKIKAAQQYAKKYKYKILTIPYLCEKEDKKFGDIVDPDINPSDFLKIIRDANCILTDSFHASVFSLVFKKDFWVFGRNAGTYNMNTRLDTLLDYYDASKRMISPNELIDKEKIRDEYNTSKVDSLRVKSIGFLIDALGSK